jgi:L-ribulose-5-phosphate 3-epimerase
MKKAISIWSFPAQMSIDDCLRMARHAGFDGIELSLNEQGPMSLESDESEIIHYRDLSRKAGIEIHSLASGLYWSYSLTSNNPATRQKSLEIARKQIDAAKLLGAEAILMLPGVVHADFIRDCEVVDYDIAYDRSLQAVQEIAQYAELRNIQIGLENVWNKFLLSPLEMKAFIDKIGSDYIGAYLDVGNVVNTGFPEQWIKILNKRIKKVHFKDYRREVGGLAGFVDLLAGDVNYPAVIKALQEAGYDNYVTAEMIPPVPFYKYYPEQLIYNTSLAMDRILGRE